MTDRLSTSDIRAMLAGAARCLRAKHEYLSQLDCVSGDGDHGTTMLKAAEQFEIAAQDPSAQTPCALLNDVGWKVLNIDGGASSALLAIFLTGMGEATLEDTLDCAAVATIFEAGITALFMQTKARVGDKTMVDALSPAVAALRHAASEGIGIDEALYAAALAAQAGADSTTLLAARYGRAKFLGDKTLGHADAGSMSIALIFHGFSQAIAVQQET